MSTQSKGLSEEQTLQVLCTLSDVPSAQVDVHALLHNVKEAPDPETAVQSVLNQISLPSDVLRRKWRTTITAVWSSHHPHVPLIPSLSLSSEDVLTTSVLQDAHAYLKELLC